MFELAEIFCDHMVIQRDRPIAVFGEGTGNGVIFFNGRIRSFIANGPFREYLPAEKAGGPYEMIVSFTDESAEKKKRRRVVIRDVMVGDVFLAGGQSNMEFKLGESAKEERTYENLPSVRFFEEPHFVTTLEVPGGVPVEVGTDKAELTGKVSADTGAAGKGSAEKGPAGKGSAEKGAAGKGADIVYCRRDPAKWLPFLQKHENSFSAVAYHFACRYSQEMKVPVGIVSCNKGASRVEAWMSPETADSTEVRALIPEAHADRSIYAFNREHILYEYKLKKLLPFGLKGVLWYQGESNRLHEEAVNYDLLFEKLVNDWRRLFVHETLPFYTVQLMPFSEGPEADWTAVRLAQVRAAKAVPGVRLVTLFDTGEETLIHPLHKKALGQALANAALADEGFSYEYSGPVAERAEFTRDTVTVEFSHAEGIHFTEELLADAEVLADGEPIFFDTITGGEKVIFRTGSPADTVRVGCQNAPRHNLYNSAGYLASPFVFFRADGQNVESSGQS